MAQFERENIAIVSRHPATIEWVREVADLPADVPVIEQATVADVRDKVVYGNLPLHLASRARAVVVVEFAGDPPRGREYGREEIEAAGARLRVYNVQAVSRPEADARPASVAVVLDDEDGQEIAEIDGWGVLRSPGETKEIAEGLARPWGERAKE